MLENVYAAVVVSLALHYCFMNLTWTTIGSVDELVRQSPAPVVCNGLVEPSIDLVLDILMQFLVITSYG